MAMLDEAIQLDLHGLVEAGREKREQAAELETRAADAVEEADVRTRGILRVSAVSLWMQAGHLERAIELGRRYLREPLSPGFARELHALVNDIEARAAGLRDVPEIADSDVSAAVARLRRLEEAIVSGSVPLVSATPRAA